MGVDSYDFFYRLSSILINSFYYGYRSCLDFNSLDLLNSIDIVEKDSDDKKN